MPTRRCHAAAGADRHDPVAGGEQQRGVEPGRPHPPEPVDEEQEHEGVGDVQRQAHRARRRASVRTASVAGKRSATHVSDAERDERGARARSPCTAGRGVNGSVLARTARGPSPPVAADDRAPTPNSAAPPAIDDRPPRRTSARTRPSTMPAQKNASHGSSGWVPLTTTSSSEPARRAAARRRAASSCRARRAGARGSTRRSRRRRPRRRRRRRRPTRVRHVQSSGGQRRTSRRSTGRIVPGQTMSSSSPPPYSTSPRRTSVQRLADQRARSLDGAPCEAA